MLLILLLVDLIVNLLVVFALLVACAALWDGPPPSGPRHC